jgi:hypothetical protein
MKICPLILRAEPAATETDRSSRRILILDEEIGDGELRHSWPHLPEWDSGPSVKTSPFPFPGGLEECFLLRPHEGNANARGESLLAPPSPLGRLSRLVAGGPLEKTAKLKRCNMAIFAHFYRAHNAEHF